MQFTAKQLSELLQGTLEGDENLVVTQLSKIEEADSNSVSFIANPKYQQFYDTTKAAVLIVNVGFEPEYRSNRPALIKVEDPYSAFTLLLDLFQPKITENTGIDALAFVHPTAKVSSKASIAPFVYIGKNAIVGDYCVLASHVHVGDNVTIAPSTTIHSGVKIYHDTHIGSNCIIHSGAIIGSDGFGFAPQANGEYQKVAQIGNVVIEDHVEIGANSTIDRATMGHTVIRKGVKIDNLVHLAHNVEIGENTVIAAQTGISGSTKLDRNCVVGGQVGFVGHLYIAPGTQINAQSGIAKSIQEPNRKWNGSPAFDYYDSMRSLTVLRRLPELEKKVQDLEKLIAQLQNVK